MAMKNLSVQEMITLSAAWVSPDNEAHGVLSANPRTAALLPDLKRAHDAIHAVAPRVENPRSAEIARLSFEEDLTHDRLAGAIHGVLTQLALLDDSGNGAPLLSLRDVLFPDGLAAAVQTTYRGQAGYARLLRVRLTPDVRSALAAIPVGPGHLLERVEAWLAAADRLGALEEERARLEAPEGESLGKQTLLARNAWIRVVNAFVGIAALAELDEASERMVFGPLRDAEATANARAARRSAAKTTPEPALAGGT